MIYLLLRLEQAVCQARSELKNICLKSIHKTFCFNNRDPWSMHPRDRGALGGGGGEITFRSSSPDLDSNLMVFIPMKALVMEI